MNKDRDGSVTPQTPLKLFVVHEDSPNPEDWSIWSEWSLVLAENKEQAWKLAEVRKYTKIAEVAMKPGLIVAMTEPNWGDDL